MTEVSHVLKKAKFWNMILLIFSSIGGVIGIMGVPALLDPAKQAAQFEQTLRTAKNPAMMASMTKTLAQINQPSYRIYSLIMLGLSLILVACFFQANQAFNQGKLVSKWPYYLHIVKIILAMLASLVSGSFLLDLSLSVTALAFNIIWGLPALLILRLLKEDAVA